MQINNIQSYGNSVVNNIINNKITKTNPSFGIKVKTPTQIIEVPDSIKTIDALKKHLESKNLLGLLGIVGTALGINQTVKNSVSPEQIENTFKDLDIKYEKDKQSGLYTIDEFVITKDNKKKYTEVLKKHHTTGNDLFEHIKKINRNADFGNTEITSLGNLREIGETADFENSQINSFNNLEKIGGNAYFGYSQITSLDNLKKVGGNAYFGHSKITTLGNLEEIGGYAVFKNSKIITLDNLKKIGKYARIGNAEVKYLNKLQSICKDGIY